MEVITTYTSKIFKMGNGINLTILKWVKLMQMTFQNWLLEEIPPMDIYYIIDK